MIEKLRLQDFRSITDITLETSNFKALLRPSSIRKTSTIKALVLFRGEVRTTKAGVSRKYLMILGTYCYRNGMKRTGSLKNSNGCNRAVNPVRFEWTITPDVSAEIAIISGNTFYGQELFKKCSYK